MPTHYLALDIGSTTVVAIVIDLDTNSVVGAASAANSSEVTSAADKRVSRSEWNLNAMTELAIDNAAALVARTNAQPAAIGVTGQQQGLQLLDAALDTVGPYFSWQDQRAQERLPGQQHTYLDVMAQRGGATGTEREMPAFANTGCPLVAGHAAPHLFWLQANNQLPSGVSGTAAPEFVVSRLVGKRPVVDPTDALGWGVYDVAKRAWADELIAALGLDQSLFPDLAESCTMAGPLTAAMAQKLGVPAGLPVAVASGDHQCSFAGTVADYANTVAVNVGTGGQAALHIEAPLPRGSLELRPYIQRGYLLAGVGAVGGRTFRTLRDFFADAIYALADVQPSAELRSKPDGEALYARLVALAADVPAGAEGVRADPLFSGSRRRPRAKAAFRELTAATLTAGHLTRALLEGMAVELADSYREAILLGGGARSKLVGAGNGIKLNPVLRAALEAEFAMPLHVGPHGEEAAVGAALCAAVADGAFGSIDEASAAFTSRGRFANRPLPAH